MADTSILIEIMSLGGGLLTLAICVRVLAQKVGIASPVLLIIAGMLVNWLAPLTGLTFSTVTSAQWTHDIILLVLLPIMVFETAYNMDVEKFAANRWAIFILAVPGVLFTTLLIATPLHFLMALEWPTALLCGVILSATDPTATIAIFRGLGVPRDLLAIVEGESLLNDATTIALTGILLTLFGTELEPFEVFRLTVWELISQFGGGVLCGLITSWLFLKLLERLPDEPFNEITASILVVISSFLIADHLFQVSGIVTLTTIGLTLAGRAPLPITKKSAQYMRSFWEYIADLAKTLIFILVGFWIDLQLILDYTGTTLLTLLAMFLARAAFIYWVLPYLGRLKRQDYSLPNSYQYICVWGGIRGAVTLALGLGVLSNIEALHADQRQIFFAVVLGAVLFTMLVQGATMGELAKRLCPASLSIEDEIAQKQLRLSAIKKALSALHHLLSSPLGKHGAPQESILYLQQIYNEQQKEITHLCNQHIEPEQQLKRFVMRGLSLEISYAYMLFDVGIISPECYRRLRKLLDEQLEAAKHGYEPPDTRLIQLKKLWRIFPMGNTYSQRVELQYELAWARNMGISYTLKELPLEFETGWVPKTVELNVMKIWQAWLKQNIEQIERLEQSNPVIIAGLQREWIARMNNTVVTTHLQKYVEQRYISDETLHSIVNSLKHRIPYLLERK